MATSNEDSTTHWSSYQCSNLSLLRLSLIDLHCSWRLSLNDLPCSWRQFLLLKQSFINLHCSCSSSKRSSLICIVGDRLSMTCPVVGDRSSCSSCLSPICTVVGDHLSSTPALQLETVPPHQSIHHRYAL